VPDKAYISMSYFIKTRAIMNWKNPTRFREKLNWLKLYDRDPKYNVLVDKYEVKKYYEDTIGGEYVIPTIDIWDNADDIVFENLPNEFVIKCTHDSGSTIVCKDKNKLDICKAKKMLGKHMNRNLYYLNREWPYKNVKSRIICEPLLKNRDNSPLNDYKIFCFNGEPKIVYVTFGRGKDEKLTINYYDLNWNKLNIRHINYSNYEGEFIPPKSFSVMLELARKLSKGIPFVRTDFYDVNGKIYVGEMTFYPDGGWGFHKSTPKQTDIELGDMIQLPAKGAY
jgi:hypothetical protein